MAWNPQLEPSLEHWWVADDLADGVISTWAGRVGGTLGGVNGTPEVGLVTAPDGRKTASFTAADSDRVHLDITDINDDYSIVMYYRTTTVAASTEGIIGLGNSSLKYYQRRSSVVRFRDSDVIDLSTFGADTDFHTAVIVVEDGVAASLTIDGVHTQAGLIDDAAAGIPKIVIGANREDTSQVYSNVDLVELAIFSSPLDTIPEYIHSYLIRDNQGISLQYLPVLFD